MMVMEAPGAERPPARRRTGLPIAAAVVLGIALLYGGDSVAWARTYPDSLIVPLDRALATIINWLLRKADFGVFTFREATRAIGALFDAPMILLKQLLATGFKVEIGATMFRVPPLSWLAVTGMFIAFGLLLKDRWLAVLAGASFLYVAAFGLWQSTMVTFASVLVAVAIGVTLGVLLGILCYRWRWLDNALTPVLDFMQTVPVFAYLVPTLMLFGYGPAGALVITLIYSMPPMVRVTVTALAQVDQDVIDLGRMVGCSGRQLLSRVLLPSARPRIMLGVNQVIMLTLNMVIIASMIGAGGLGFDVWQALKSLRLGEGAEAGIAITLLAIVLDRMSQRVVTQRQEELAQGTPFLGRSRWIAGIVCVAVILTLAGIWIAPLAEYPTFAQLSTGRFWDGIVDWINIRLHAYIGPVRDFFFVHVLRPTKTFLLSLPWLAVVVFTGALGFRLGGTRLAALGGTLTAFIAVVGLWEPAMVSLYLVGVCVALSAALGIPMGIAAAANDRLHRILQVVLDTLQTLPAFVYLIPVIMLFSVGDFSAMIAIVLYAVVPAIRYTDHAIRQVPAQVVEAARAFGCTRWQLHRRVIFPLALPDIVLGLNQTLMLGVSMLVITALVGTRDLGQETLIALSKADPGRGVIAGVCAAFMAIVADRLIRAWVDQRREILGLGLPGQ